MHKNIYKWHRSLSLIIAIPALLWAASGFMHPIMTNIRPAIATQAYPATHIDTSKIRISISAAAKLNGIGYVDNFRFIHIDTNWFYQVRESSFATPVYLSTETGKKLKNGDKLYAQYLAKIFLEGMQTKADSSDATQASQNQEQHDCCDAATRCVLMNQKGAPITAVSRVDDFKGEYKSVNRILPVYKVSFDRPDGIRIYVETFADKFVYAVDDKRATFDSIFSFFHTFSWLDSIEDIKYLIIILFMMLTMSTAILGIYIFFKTKSKKVPGNKVVSARNNHRVVSVVFSLFTLLFSFSGAYHAWENSKPDHRYDYFVSLHKNVDSLDLNLSSLESIVHQPIYNVGLVKLGDDYFWQVDAHANKNEAIQTSAPKDLMKSMHASMKEPAYVSFVDMSLLKDGEKKYAAYLASEFSGNEMNAYKGIEPITKFEGEYGFVNKRLPVWKVKYDVNNNERYYVETSSGRLSVRIDDADLWEGYSFSFLHKHHFMDFAGKSWRDFSTMFWAMGQIALIVTGLVFWLRKKK